jgi:3',5'-cyclic AMP phosphodiesterase CpdA
MAETETILLHLTDLHFGDDLSKSISFEGFTYNDIAKLIATTIKENHTCKKIIIALGGDITNKGAAKKYQYAHEFMSTLKNELPGIEFAYILCPGNHDIETSSSNWFGNFNIFSGELTGEQNFIYSTTRTSILYEKWGHSFVIVNSLYHGDHKFGFVDMTSVEEKLSAAKKTIILLIHHHLIPILKEDISTTRNSYDFLRLCLKYKVKLIIHGHIHSSFKLSFFQEQHQTFCNEITKVDIIGCGATLPEIGTNYNNQFNVIDLKKAKANSISSYRIIYDSHKSHKPQTTKTIL